MFEQKRAERGLRKTYLLFEIVS